jgi:hypothetical protein
MTPQLTELQQQTLRAVVDRIIPPDDYPGAWDAGIGDYLARQFEGDLALQLDLFTKGLDGLEADFEAGVKNQRVLDAVERSAQSHRWETV